MIKHFINQYKPHKIGVIGVGNIIRSDDAIGNYICNEIEAMHIPNVTTLCVHQLNTEMLDEFAKYDEVIVVDAAVEGAEVDFYAAGDIKKNTVDSSHSLSSETLVKLFESLYGRKLNLYICSVRGEDFSIGNQLSQKALTNIAKAIDLLTYRICNLSL